MSSETLEVDEDDIVDLSLAQMPSRSAALECRAIEAVSLKPSSDNNRRAITCVMVIFGGAAMVCVFIAVSVWYLLNLNSESHGNLQDVTQLESSDLSGSAQSRAVPTTNQVPAPRSRKRESGVSLNPPEIKRSHVTSKREYSFDSKEKVNYNVTISVNKGQGRPLVFEALNTIQRYDNGTLPKNLKTRLSLTGNERKYSKKDHLVFESTGIPNIQGFGLYPSQIADSFYEVGAIELSGSGQPTSQWTLDSDETIPLILLPYSRAGIEDLGPPGESKWSTVHRVTVVSVGQANRSPLAHIQSRFDRRSILGGRFSGSTFPNGLYDSTPNVGLSVVTRRVDYKVRTTTATDIHVDKTVTIKTIQTNGDATSHSAKATGYFIFDKKKGIVTTSVLKGTAGITVGDVTIQLPFDYSCSYYETVESSTLAKLESKKLDPNTLGAWVNKGGGVKSLAFGPNGNLFIGSADGTICVYDPVEKRQLAQTKKLERAGDILGMDFSANRSVLLTSGAKGRVVSWQVDEKGSLTRQSSFVGHLDAVPTVAIARNGRTVASSDDKKLLVWDLDTLKRKHVYSGFERVVKAVHFSRDGKTIYATDGDRFLKADLETGAIKLFANLINRSFLGCAFSANGDRLAIIRGKVVVVLATKNLRVKSEVEIGTAISAVTFSPDGSRIFVGTKEGIGEWDLLDGKKVNTFACQSPGKVIRVSRDGTRLATFGTQFSNAVYVFNIPGGRIENSESVDSAAQAVVPAKRNETNSSVHHLNGVQNLIWQSDKLLKQICLLDVTDQGLVRVLQGTSMEIYDLKKSSTPQTVRKLDSNHDATFALLVPSGKKLLTCLRSGIIRIRSISESGTLHEEHEFAGHSSRIERIVVSPNDKFVMSSDEDKRIRIWDLERCKELCLIGDFENRLMQAHFAPDSKSVLATDGISVLDIEVVSGEILSKRKLPFSNRPSGLSFSKDGTKLAAAFFNELKVFDVKTWDELSSFVIKHPSSLLEFSPDAESLFVNDYKAVAQWDWKSGERTIAYDVPNSIAGFSISDNGEYLTTFESSSGMRLNVFRVPD